MNLIALNQTMKYSPKRGIYLVQKYAYEHQLSLIVFRPKPSKTHYPMANEIEAYLIFKS